VHDNQATLQHQILRSNTMANPALHHINIKTTRLAAMIDWYGTVVGMVVVHRAPVGAWLSNDTANHRLALLSLPDISDDPDKAKHAGLHHTAFEFSTTGDLLEHYGRLQGAGIAPHMCLDHGMTTSLYYRDPDGNLVELQADNFGDWSKSKAWMATAAEFAANPIGQFFDPAKVYAAFRAGASAADLHTAILAGQFMPAEVPNLMPS
jgi:catechol 2,3-dioxygenase